VAQEQCPTQNDLQSANDQRCDIKCVFHGSECEGENLGIHLLETLLRVFPYHINKKNRRKATIDTTRTLTTALGDSGRLIAATIPIERQIAANITASRFDLLLPSSLSTGTRSNTPDVLHLFLFFARPRSSLSCGPCVILATNNW